jgi:hypothetical protein
LSLMRCPIILRLYTRADGKQVCCRFRPVLAEARPVPQKNSPTALLYSSLALALV